MPLTAAQLQTLKTNIAANSNTINLAGGAVAINATANTLDIATEIANQWYNIDASPVYLVWKTNVPKSLIRSNVVLANYTPTDAVPASPSTDLTYSNRAFIAQLKQTNALFLVTGDENIDASNANIRQSFQDCMRQIPTGASGANQDAGWGAPASPGAVRTAMQRSAKNIEKLFSVAGSGTGNTGTDPRGSATNPDVMVFEGAVTGTDVKAARDLP